MINAAKMRVYTIILLLTHYPLLVNATYNTLRNKPEATFKEYHKTKIEGKVKYSTTSDHKRREECIQHCRLDSPTCRAINVKRQSVNPLSWLCNYFAESATADYSIQGDYIVYTLEKPVKCTNYCQEFDYLDLCGTCKCTNTCRSLFTHYCDCTKAIPLATNCSSAPISGMYNLKLSSKTVKGFCHVQNTTGTKYLIWMRRFRPTTTDNFRTHELPGYENGFGRPYDPKYWLGLQHVASYTHLANTVLRVELMDSDGNVRWGEYERFRVTGYKVGDEMRYRYEYLKYATDCCLLNIFHEQSNYLKKCADSSFWFDNCADSNTPTGSGTIRLNGVYYKRITLLLEHRESKKSTGLSIKRTQGCFFHSGVTDGVKTKLSSRPNNRGDCKNECVKLGIYNAVWYDKVNKECFCVKNATKRTDFGEQYKTCEIGPKGCVFRQHYWVYESLPAIHGHHGYSISEASCIAFCLSHGALIVGRHDWFDGLRYCTCVKEGGGKIYHHGASYVSACKLGVQGCLIEQKNGTRYAPRRTKIVATTSDECIQACINMKDIDSSVNSASYNSEDVKNTCTCNHDSTSMTKDFLSCFIDQPDNTCPALFKCQANKYHSKKIFRDVEIGSLEECKKECCIQKTCTSLNYDSGTKRCKLSNSVPKSSELSDQQGNQFCVYRGIQSGFSYEGDSIDEITNAKNGMICAAYCRRNDLCDMWSVNTLLNKCYLFKSEDATLKDRTLTNYLIGSRNYTFPRVPTGGIQMRANMMIGTVRKPINGFQRLCVSFEFYIGYSYSHNTFMIRLVAGATSYLEVYERNSNFYFRSKHGSYHKYYGGYSYKLRTWNHIKVEFAERQYKIYLDNTLLKTDGYDRVFTRDLEVYVSIGSEYSDGILHNLYLNGKHYYLPDNPPEN